MINIFKRKQTFEILTVCIFSGIGMIYSGSILDNWRLSNIFDATDDLWIIVTPLLGLKGNIEMTLACRLSTMVKLGQLKSVWTVGLNNIIIIQIQGLLVGLGAACFGYVVNILLTFSFSVHLVNKFIRLVFISVLTASISSFILGIVTIAIVFYSWKLQFDPDNIATPLAAAMGDTVTLFVLYTVSTYCATENHVASAHFIILVTIFLFFIPFLFSRVNSRDFPGWSSILIAMFLSSFSGWILKQFVFVLHHLAVFQPLVNGIGGNVASVYCSSLSTKCHEMKKWDQKKSDKLTDFKELFKSLILLNIMVHCILLIICSMFHFISLTDVVHLICPYFCAVICQTFILLILSKQIVLFMWKNNIDPDNGAIPLITGFGDLLGTSLLSISLLFVNF